MITIRVLTVGPILALLALNLERGSGDAVDVLAVAVAVVSVAAIERWITLPLRAVLRQAEAVPRARPARGRVLFRQFAALSETIEFVRQAALQASVQDAQSEAELAHRTETLRALDNPLRLLQVRSASLCELGAVAAQRLAEASEALAALGPIGVDVAEPLREAASSVSAEHAFLRSACDRMNTTVQAMRISPDQPSQPGQERRTSERLRAGAATLIEVVSAFSAIVGRINRPSLAAMGTVVTDQQRLAAPELVRVLSDRIAGTAEELGREMGGLHGALREVVLALEHLARRPAAEAAPPSSIAVMPTLAKAA